MEDIENSDRASTEPVSTTSQRAKIWNRVAPKLQYVLICIALVGVLKLGHATQWSVPDLWAGAASSSASESQPAHSSSASSGRESPASAAPAGNAMPAHGMLGGSAAATIANTPVTDTGSVALSAEQLRKSGVELHRAERRSVDQAIAAHGVVEYDLNHVAQLSSRVPGIVWRVERKAGETIRKGDVLAIVEAIEVGRIKADLLRAIVDEDLRRTTVERLRSAGPALAERLLREAEADYRQSRILVRNLIQTLVNLGLPASLEELRALDDDRRARKLQFLGLPESLVATLDPAKTTGNLLPLIAPFDGVVIGREITIGETVSPEDSHFTIADVSRMWVTLEVRKEDASVVRMGQEVQFQADGVAGRINGTVDWISTAVDEQTRTLQVRAEVPNAVVAVDAESGRQQRLLMANTFGIGRIVTNRDPVAVVVPNDAVHFDGKEHFVFVLEDGRFRRQPIVPGVVAGGMTEIRSGIDEGARVAAAGSHLIKSEMSLLAAKP